MKSSGIPRHGWEKIPQFAKCLSFGGPRASYWGRYDMQVGSIMLEDWGSELSSERQKECDSTIGFGHHWPHKCSCITGAKTISGWHQN